MKPTPIGHILQESLERMEIKDAIREKLALFEWEGAAGAEIARHSRPVRVDRGVMTLETASPAWAQQLSLLKPKLLEAINARLGERLIKDLRFRSGQGFESDQHEESGLEATAARGSPARGLPSPFPAPARPEDEAALRALAAEIKDPALRERWLRVLRMGSRPGPRGRE